MTTDSLGEYTTLTTRVEGRVARVTVDNPPINLLDIPMIIDLARLGDALAARDDLNVAVVDSADEDFFIAHADVGLILDLPQPSPSEEPAPAPVTAESEELGAIHGIFERWRTLPMVTIACIDGIARGGGSEFALALDMRFGSLERAVLGQPEVTLGILPGGGGTQRLNHLVGRARALEIVCGGEDFEADMAERYGYLNRALPADRLKPFVDDLAARIASFPPESVRLNKQAVLQADRTIVPGLRAETHLFNRTLALPEARRRMQTFMEHGGQTREVEARLNAVREVTDRLG